MTANGHARFFNEAYFDEIGGRSLAAAKVIVPLLVEWFAPASVVDVGCGTGAWLAVFQNHGARDVLGLDGEYIQRSQLLIPRESFRAVDLACLQKLDRAFDLAVCLEAAHYLTAEQGAALARFLAASAPVVLFSSAVPGQPGAHHVNPQWPAWWIRLFQEQGFLALDPIRPRVWHEERVALHFRQNILLFARRDRVEGPQAIPGLSRAPRANCLTLVDQDTLATNLGLRAGLRRLARRITDNE